MDKTKLRNSFRSLLDYVEEDPHSIRTAGYRQKVEDVYVAIKNLDKPTNKKHMHVVTKQIITGYEVKTLTERFESPHYAQEFFTLNKLEQVTGPCHMVINEENLSVYKKDDMTVIITLTTEETE